MTARALLFGLITVLAIHWTVTSGFERHCSLLSAPGTDHAGASRFALVSPTVRLFVFLCLAAWFATFGSRIATFTKELLFFARKREFLPAVAAHQLKISHGFLSSIPCCYFIRKYVWIGVLVWSEADRSDTQRRMPESAIPTFETVSNTQAAGKNNRKPKPWLCIVGNREKPV